VHGNGAPNQGQSAPPPFVPVPPTQPVEYVLVSISLQLLHSDRASSQVRVQLSALVPGGFEHLQAADQSSFEVSTASWRRGHDCLAHSASSGGCARLAKNNGVADSKHYKGSRT
jgi:hypothetical protein